MPEVNLRERSPGTWWEVEEEFATVSLPAIERVAQAGLEKAGASASDAAYIVKSYVDKTLQGDHARGIARLPSLVRQGLNGETNFKVKIRIIREKSATALVAAGHKDNHRLVAKQAMELAIEKARKNGIGWVGAPGNAEVLRVPAQMAAEAGMIGFVTTAGVPNVAPLGGYESILHNGPFAFAIPVAGRDPLVLDMSSTESSGAGVYLAARQGQEVRPGIILDSQGNPTTRATDFPDMELLKNGVQTANGTLTTLGNSHKSYGLILALGLLCFMTADGCFPWEVGKQPKEQGAVFAAIDPSAFLPGDEGQRRAGAFLDRVKASPPKKGGKPILYPGESSQRLQREKRKAGKVAIPASQYRAFVKLAEELGMKGAL